MDPVTHLTSGILGGLAARRWFPRAKYFLPFCMLAAWIPDVDIFFGNGDPEFNLLYHRSISTSFFGGILLALGVAGLYKLVARDTLFKQTAPLAYCLIILHIWLDLITTYGTQIFSPFSNHRYALDGAFIIDPLFTGSALILLLLAFFKKKWRQMIGWTGLAWFILYPCINMATGAYLETVYARQLEARNIPYEMIHVTPDALSPRFWKVVTTSGSDYLLDTIDLFDLDKVNEPERHRRAELAQLEQLGQQVSLFSTYAWFAKWPHVQETATDTGRTLTFGDLRFRSTNPVLASLFKDRKLPFILVGVLDENGTIVSWTYNRGASSLSNQEAVR